MDMKKAIGKALKLCRTACELTQEEVGKALGVSYQQIQKYEKGANEIKATRLYDIAEIYGKRPEHIFEKAETLLEAHSESSKQ